MQFYFSSSLYFVSAASRTSWSYWWCFRVKHWTSGLSSDFSAFEVSGPSIYSHLSLEALTTQTLIFTSEWWSVVLPCTLMVYILQQTVLSSWYSLCFQSLWNIWNLSPVAISWCKWCLLAYFSCPFLVFCAGVVSTWIQAWTLQYCEVSL